MNVASNVVPFGIGCGAFESFAEVAPAIEIDFEVELPRILKRLQVGLW